MKWIIIQGKIQIKLKKQNLKKLQIKVLEVGTSGGQLDQLSIWMPAITRYHKRGWHGSTIKSKHTANNEHH